MEGGGTVRLRGGAAMGSTVLVGMCVRLKETALAGSAGGQRRRGEKDGWRNDKEREKRRELNAVGGLENYAHFMMQILA